MSLKGNWLDDSDTVSIEWYDYNIDYSGKRSVRYTVKSSGLIIILNNEFPFQHSVWKIGDYAVIIQYINSMVDR